jgi:hypothetical protein
MHVPTALNLGFGDYPKMGRQIRGKPNNLRGKYQALWGGFTPAFGKFFSRGNRGGFA